MFRVAGIAFIGGSLVAKGGHNPFEAARLGCAVLHGGDMSNCAGMAAALDRAGAALTVSDAESLGEAVARLLGDPGERRARAKAAARVAAAGSGVLDEVLARLAPCLDALAPAAAACSDRPASAHGQDSASASSGRGCALLNSGMRRPGLLPGCWRRSARSGTAPGRCAAPLSRPYRAPVPVVCVGNLVAGGSGKTPVVLSLVELHRRKRRRGACRDARLWRAARRTGARRSDPARRRGGRRRSVAAGANAAPCWVARDRAAGCREAAAAGAEIIVLDDGFQNPGIAKDLSLVVIDAEYGFGNGRLIPAGPLREPVRTGLARADADRSDRRRRTAGSGAHGANGRSCAPASCR